MPEDVIKPKALSLSEDDQKILVDFVMERFNTLSRNRADEEDRWRKRWRQFKSIIDKITYPFISAYFQPESNSLVRHAIAKTAQYILGADRLIECEAEPEGDGTARDKINAQNQEDLILAQLRAMKFERVLIEALGWAVPVGTAWGKVRWEKRVRARQVGRQAEGVDRTEYGPGEVVEHDGPVVDAISPWQVYISLSANSVQDPGGLIHAYVLNNMEVRAKGGLGADGWINTDDVKGDGDVSNDPSEKTAQAEGRTSPSYEGEFKQNKILHYWGPLPKEVARVLGLNEGDEAEIAIDEKRRILHYAGPNKEPHGLRPFIAFVVDKYSGKFYGEGAMAQVEDLQHELNDTVNQGNDLMNQLANPPLIHTPEETDHLKNFVFGANARLMVEDLNNIDFMRPQNIPADMWRKQAAIVESMEKTVGIHRYDRGIQPERQETATGIGMLQRGAAPLHLLVVRMIEATALEPLAGMMGIMNQVNITEPKHINVKRGKKTETKSIRPEDIAGTFNYTFLGSAKQEALTRVRANYPQLYEMLSGNEKVNQQELLRMLLEAAGVQSPDNLLEDPLDDAARAAMEGMQAILIGEVAPPKPEYDHEAELKVHPEQIELLVAAGKQREAQILMAHTEQHIAMLTGQPMPEQVGAPGIEAGGNGVPDDYSQAQEDKSEILREANQAGG